jgi:hypothetical protein
MAFGVKRGSTNKVLVKNGGELLKWTFAILIYIVVNPK